MSDIMDLIKVYRQLGHDEDVLEMAEMTLDTCNKVSEDIEKLTHEFDKEGAKLVDGKVVLPKGNDEVYKQMAELGLLSLIAPEKYDGAQMPYSLHMACVETISRACASTAVGMCVHGTSIDLIDNFGTEEAKKKYIPQLASGEKLGLIAFSEPNSGSDLGSAKTKAILDEKGEYYVMNGVKQFITNGGYAKVMIVIGLTEPELGPKGLSSFVVDFSEGEGFSVAKVEDKFGIKASPTSQIVFEDFKVPKENLLGVERKGFHIVLWGLNGGRISIGAQATGISDTAYKKAFQYANERMQFGVTINSFPAIREKLALMAARLHASRLSYLDGANLKDIKEPFIAQAAAAKLFASESSEFICRESIQIHGGYGYMKEYDPERLYRDSRITTIYEGTNEIIRFVISRDLLGEESSSMILSIKKLVDEIKGKGEYKDLAGEVENGLGELEKNLNLVKNHEHKFGKQLNAISLVNLAVAVYISALTLKYTVKSGGAWENETRLIISEMSRDVAKYAAEIQSSRCDIISKFVFTGD